MVVLFVLMYHDGPAAAGIERLLRAVYRHSKPGSFPTVVLLASASANAHEGQWVVMNIVCSCTADHSASSSVKYSDTYRLVAEHYRLPLWSFRDVVTSPFAVWNQSDYIEV